MKIKHILNILAVFVILLTNKDGARAAVITTGTSNNRMAMVENYGCVWNQRPYTVQTWNSATGTTSEAVFCLSCDDLANIPVRTDYETIPPAITCRAPTSSGRVSVTAPPSGVPDTGGLTAEIGTGDYLLAF